MADSHADIVASLNRLTQQQIAELFVDALRMLGARFTTREDGTFWCDLNGIPDMDYARADGYSRVLLTLRSEVRVVLAAEHVTH